MSPFVSRPYFAYRPRVLLSVDSPTRLLVALSRTLSTLLFPHSVSLVFSLPSRPSRTLRIFLALYVFISGLSYCGSLLASFELCYGAIVGMSGSAYFFTSRSFSMSGFLLVRDCAELSTA